MNDQQQSRADALTEAERLLLARVNDCTKPIDAADRNGILKLIDRLAACPVEQPAAALVDIEARFIAEHGHRLAQLLRIDAFDIADRDAQIMSALRGDTAPAPAPAPADERAAFETLKGAWQSMPPFDVFCAGWRAARAASANETGAEGVPLAMALNPNAPPLTMTLGPAQAAEPVAQWQARLKDRSSPVVDHWVNISPDGAKTLMEKYADVYEVRALYAAPQPAQADAREPKNDAQPEGGEIAESPVPQGEAARSVSAREGLTEPRECRHCGWMCIPNSTPSKTWYPLPQPRAEVTDEQIADMFERVTGYSLENGRAALNDADILGFARELLEAARAGEAS
ncbi:hypothetical protein L0Z11_11485 [Burkholderia multivorans]|uniref:hypothetical protein n=1 Tax=Burkholderia multivorans TaxID=87883 RepID=UPI00201856A1|nr:hypothetical protein [Burkholderia multivorans]UQN68308.1 hypothetical protein L0Z45_11505 [Burkholderia multivorans]UQN74037.1 hypothetical protein L0Z11_11485 [Burkholderia multivorans]